VNLELRATLDAYERGASLRLRFNRGNRLLPVGTTCGQLLPSRVLILCLFYRVVYMVCGYPMVVLPYRKDNSILSIDNILLMVSDTRFKRLPRRRARAVNVRLGNAASRRAHSRRELEC
jgi:hypothetical protein